MGTGRDRQRGRLDGRITSIGWLVGLAVTGLVLATPHLHFAYRAESLHLILDACDGSVAVLVAYLLHGRFLRTRGLRDLLLVHGMLLFALAGVGLDLLLILFRDFRPQTIDVWVPLTLRVAGAGLVLAAALAGEHRLSRTGRLWVAGARVVLLGLVVALFLGRDQLPVALDAAPLPSARNPLITGHPLLLSGQAAVGVCFAVASVRFTTQAWGVRDELLRWLGPACALGALAGLNYLLFPSIYTDWLYTGDLLRTASYLVLLVGAAREIREYWEARARVAVLEDRRRLARDLHDGVVQEIAYIRAEAVAAEAAAPGRIISACDRALGEARAAIEALGRDEQEPLGFALHRAAHEVAERYAGRIEVDLDESVAADAPQRQALVRITREAVSNALRHGGAGLVSVRLLHDQEDRRQLVVADDGAGFEVAAVMRSSPGYGLTSMSERARALPGEIQIVSVPSRGTEVGVSW